MVTIKRFGVVSVGFVFGMSYAFIGFILGLSIALGVSNIGEMMNFMPLAERAMIGMMRMLGESMFRVAVVFIWPLMYGFFGFIGGIILATLYNLFAKWVGGIQVELVSRN